MSRKMTTFSCCSPVVTLYHCTAIKPGRGFRGWRWAACCGSPRHQAWVEVTVGLFWDQQNGKEITKKQAEPDHAPRVDSTQVWVSEEFRSVFTLFSKNNFIFFVFWPRHFFPHPSLLISIILISSALKKKKQLFSFFMFLRKWDF